jgi:hypothetical protein
MDLDIVRVAPLNRTDSQQADKSVSGDSRHGISPSDGHHFAAPISRVILSLFQVIERGD